MECGRDRRRREMTSKLEIREARVIRLTWSVLTAIYAAGRVLCKPGARHDDVIELAGIGPDPLQRLSVVRARVSDA